MVEQATGVEKLRRAIQRLVRSEDLWGWVLAGLDVRESNKVPLAQVRWSQIKKRYYIEFNPNAVDFFTQDEIAAVLQHELIHRAMQHRVRLQGWESRYRQDLPINFKKELINAGKDCAVHEIMDPRYVSFMFNASMALKFLPCTSLMYGMPRNQSAEFYVDKLLEMATVQKSDEPSENKKSGGIEITLPIMVIAPGGGSQKQDQSYRMGDNNRLQETAGGRGDKDLKDAPQSGQDSSPDKGSEEQEPQSGEMGSEQKSDTGESMSGGKNAMDSLDNGEGEEMDAEDGSEENTQSDGEGEEDAASGKSDEEKKAAIMSEQLRQDAEEEEEHPFSEAEIQNYVLEREITQAVDSIEKAKGYIPGNIKELLKRLPTRKLRWDQLLKNFVLTNLGGERRRSWARPNRRDVDCLPGRKPSRAPKTVLFCVDTSGSMRTEDLGKALSVMEDILKRYPNTRLLMAQGDTNVNRVEFVKKKLPQMEMWGRGGTELAEFIRLMDTVNADVNIIYTDGIDYLDRTAPRRQNYGKLVFVFTQRNSSVEKWARTKNCMVIHVDV